MSTSQGTSPIAIIGLGCLFPDAASTKQFWANLRHGVDSIRNVPESHWSREDYLAADPKSKDRIYVAKGGFLPSVEFAPLEFGIAPNTLEAIDTTQLLGLMAADAALKDAGYGTAEFDRSRASVILGVTGALPLVIPLGARLGHPLWRRALRDAGVPEEQGAEVVRRISEGYVGWQEDSFPGLLGNVVAGRIANRFNFGGTNCVVDAACASSLSAVHLAILELTVGKSDLVVTGGFDTFNDIFMYMCFSKTPALSPTGQSRPFAAEGDGTTLGEGLGCLILKRLADAERDGDRIYAVIKSLAASSDGKGHAIYAPSAKGQARAVRAALEQAGVLPEEIDLVEAHGTGTKAGDLAELQGLLAVHGGRMRSQACALGSVKSQIGHTKAAAGAAGLVKAALALHHKVIPPTLKVDQPLPELLAADCPFYLPNTARPWVSPHRPRRAAVSSFGFGGSNFHAVLEEYSPRKPSVDWDGCVEIVPLCASTQKELREQVSTLSDSQNWAAFQRFAATARATFSPQAQARLVLVLEANNGSLSKLKQRALHQLDQSNASAWTMPEGISFGSGPHPGPIALLFPGQGSQRVGMQRELFLQFPEAFAVLESVLSPTSVSDVIFPPPAWSEEARQKQEQTLQRTENAQPALGAVSLAAYEVLKRFRLPFAATAGHSFGEFTALAAAGWITPSDLHRLSAQRGKLLAHAIQEAPGGMAAVQGTSDQLDRLAGLLPDVAWVANRNSPTQWVLAGTPEGLLLATAVAGQLGLQTRRLAVAGPFHSPCLAKCRMAFAETLAHVNITPTSVPVVSNTTGHPFPANGMNVKEILARQLCEPIDFTATVRSLADRGCRTFVEVGPGNVLSRLAATTLADHEGVFLSVDASLGRRSAVFDLARALGQLMALGYPLDVSDWQSDFGVKQAASARPTFTVQLCGANYVQPRPVAASAATSVPELPKPAHSSPSHKQPSSDKTRDNGKAKPVAAALPPVKATVPSMPPLPPVDAWSALLRLTELHNEIHKQFLQLQTRTLQLFQGIPTPVDSSQISETVPLLPSEAGTVSPPNTNGHATASSFPSRPDRIELGNGTSGSNDLHDRLRQLNPKPAPAQQAKELSLLPHPNVAIAAAHKNGAPKSVSSTDHLRQLVAQKTGYPVEMLELDMELDADLGIDSIKRVEIFAAIQEAWPRATTLKPEEVGKLRTLRSIAQWLDSQLGTGQLVTPTPSSPSAEVATVLREVVAAKTGYPIEMLEMSQQLDADLGIDSIKRVEIFAALREQLPRAPVLQPEQVGKLRTLGDVANYLASGEVALDSSTTSVATGEVSDRTFFYTGKSRG